MSRGKHGGRVAGGAVRIADAEALFADAVRLHHAGEIAAAERAYRRVLAIAPDHARALHGLGVLAHHRSRSDEAVSFIARAIRCDDRPPEFHCNLAVALEAVDRLDEAAASYRAAIARKSDYARAQLNLGNVLLRQAQFDAAEAAYCRASALDPGGPDAAFNLGLLLARRLRFEDAIVQFRHVVRLRPDFAAAHSQLRAA
jgi:tetratricopeptide (TPR) repeat protein